MNRHAARLAALTRDVPAAIEPLIDQRRTPIDPREARIAVFYSISNCQPGLRGISFGSFLIKQVAESLAGECPQLRRFVTLSPVPGFARWLDAHHPFEGRAVQQAADSGDAHSLAALRALLEHRVAQYLVLARDGGGRAPDPVARFRLGDGARLERINWLADTSTKGIREAAGFMVNYLYDLERVEANHEAYSNEGVVVASRPVRRLLAPPRAVAAQPSDPVETVGSSHYAPRTS